MVFVLSKDKTPLAPTNRAKARLLLKQNKAVVHKMFPFTIIYNNELSNSSPSKSKIIPRVSLEDF
ncbi:MAG TPA: hypothetical protein EYG90_04265 [Campylobacterales bacterium]|nr:hypothetical protein [Campylobacterales bacterium]